MATGAIPEVLEFPLGCGIRRTSQLLQQSLDTRHIVGHLARQADVGPVLVSQAPCLLAPQGQDLFDQRGIVELTLTGPAHMGSVDGLPQSAVLRMGEEGQIAGHVEAEEPGALAAGGRFISGFPGRGGQGVLGSVRQASNLVRFRELQRPLLGGIENVIPEAGG
ncbi:MAG: Uncharacterised protein [Synechococcus sp. CC9902]|nr:MAG: Uncharacterised protein [Synechococcus sp. CC9902]